MTWGVAACVAAAATADPSASASPPCACAARPVQGPHLGLHRCQLVDRIDHRAQPLHLGHWPVAAGRGLAALAAADGRAGLMLRRGVAGEHGANARGARRGRRVDLRQVHPPAAHVAGIMSWRDPSWAAERPCKARAGCALPAAPT